jgi:hypothetical protein
MTSHRDDPGRESLTGVDMIPQGPRHDRRYKVTPPMYLNIFYSRLMNVS